MQPRLSTSRKWSPLPAELVRQIQSVFKDSFADQIGTSKIEAQGKIFPEEILISIGIREEKVLKQRGFLISIAYRQNKDNVLKLLHLAVDAAASLFEQLFTAEDDHDFPRQWEEVDFEGRSIYVQYTTVNSELEAEADRLLGLKPDGTEDVAQGDWDADVDAETIKAQLGIDSDDDDGEGNGGQAH